MVHIPIIVSQFAPPANRGREVQRRLLNKKLQDIPSAPVTLMHGGAGYGKSTALAAFASDLSHTPSWYTISKNDDDIFPFLTKVCHAIKQHHPSFGGALLDEIAQIDGYAQTEDVYTLVSAFINETVRHQKTIILILDDFHHVSASQEIEAWILLLLEHMPDNLHLVLSTRKKPQWDIVTTMKVKGDLLEISQADLTLATDEMQFMLEDVYGLTVEESDVDSISDLTEGWAIAFNMLAQQLASGQSPSYVLANRHNSLKDLFDYLAAEVLAKQPPDIQRFLLQSSVLDVLTPDACDAVLLRQDSQTVLRDLLERNVFIAQGNQDTYRYHALFKAFLENRLEKNDLEAHDQLHERAAVYYQRQGATDLVMFHQQKRGSDEAVAKLLHEHGMDMLASGRLQALYDMLMTVPERYKEMYPVLYFCQGEIERYRSLYETAEKHYEQIIRIVPGYDQQHFDLMGLAFEGKARIYLDTIQPDKAERFIKQAIDMREKANAPKKDMGKLYILMAENLLNSGYAAKAEAWLGRAEKEGLTLENSNLQARIYLRTGKLAKAKATLQKRQQTTPSLTHKHLPQAHRETDILLSIIEAFMGNAEASKAHAAAGIDLGLAIQSPFVEACGWMRMGHAVQLLDRYDKHLARECYETALGIMEKINVSRGKAEPHMGLSIVYAADHQFDQAERHARNGLQETEKVNDRWLSALIKVSTGLTYVYQGEYVAAQAVFRDVEADMLICGDRYILMVCGFWQAYIAQQTGAEDQFEAAMKLFLEEMEAGDYDFFILRRTTFGPRDMQNLVPMLMTAKQQELAPYYLGKLFELLEIDKGMTNHPGYTLMIDTLGGLEVVLGKSEDEPCQWQREKSKELFGLFITNRGRPVQKSEIYDALWPDETEDGAGKKFKVTFNALLKTLEPNRKAREDSFFITRKGSAYVFHADRSCELDVVTFEHMVNAGIKEKDMQHAKDLLEKGLQYYRGAYLADMPHAEWSQSERERLQLLYLHGAEKMAQLFVRLLDFTACIEWCEHILQTDPTWEEAYRLMMYSYYQKDNRPQAIRWYERCCDILDGELGVEPMASTQDMYHLIIESEHVRID
ncbi:hypothetical protein JNUCC1_01492 [Lentibacillus sp. JNUCC-1]|uniref:BTAD domain-containing putative transcriptional regulator n=1 Tax=Lentibacillus sp. JNUCC-1 TaxID=2654513 RepID=UPI0012E7A016|nr:BTAD domain-containing putative transcriptional regulator [Lentibacillus sp. JNUCC-1]MUV37686.1 hypothetical protein [Lentibacillus sp. JNUCC-1]